MWAWSNRRVRKGAWSNHTCCAVPPIAVLKKMWQCATRVAYRAAQLRGALDARRSVRLTYCTLIIGTVP